MSTQVKRIKIATRNNSARIKSVDGGDYRATFTDGRELGLKRRETVWSLSGVGAGAIVTGKQIGRAHV